MFDASLTLDVIDLDATKLGNATYDSLTRWPGGFDPEAAGAKRKTEQRDDPERSDSGDARIEESHKDSREPE